MALELSSPFRILLILIPINGIICGKMEHFGQCHEGQLCIPFSECLSDSGFAFPCGENRSSICCDKEAAPFENRKASPFSPKCGLVSLANRITGGKEAELGQFPWMALLGFRQKSVNYTQFLCGGSVITDRFILTAAHCISLDRRLELVIVRLGEHNLTTDEDCIEVQKTKYCADRPVDYLVDRFLSHPKYNAQDQSNDIALIRVSTKIRFTDFITPICLTVSKDVDLVNEKKLTISGWGKTKSSNLGGSRSLQYAQVILWDTDKCNKAVPKHLRPIKGTQLCAHGEKDQDACKGDSGGPLMNSTRSEDGEMRYFQVGIVSFALSMGCGISLPTIYTRVDKYLDWITENVS